MTMKNTGWQKITVQDREWKADPSGMFCWVHYTAGNPSEALRVDVMMSLPAGATPEPVVSIAGPTAQAVRKGVADWIDSVNAGWNAEHIFYVGSELARAEILKGEYVQD